MKKIILFAITLCSIVGFAQDAPNVVKDTFTKKYSKAVNPDWSKSTLGYEVYFELDDKELSSQFSKTGTWINTQQEVEEKDLSAKVIKTLISTFKEYSIDSILLIEDTSKSYYEFYLWDADNSEFLIQVNLEGKILKKEVQESDEEDENDKDSEF